jgi:hypothetical protein
MKKVSGSRGIYAGYSLRRCGRPRYFMAPGAYLLYCEKSNFPDLTPVLPSLTYLPPAPNLALMALFSDL